LLRKVYRFSKSKYTHNENDIYKQLFRHKPDKKIEIINIGFGTNNNEYALSKTAIHNSDLDEYVVFSAGIFNDIEFEKSMIEKFDATVYSFDPTPLSAEFVKKQIRSGQVDKRRLKHTECGIEVYNGTAEFNVLPDEDGGVGSSVIDRVDENGKGYPRKIKVNMKTIGSLIKEKNIDHIDCMKLDIEGSEFAVIEDYFGHSNSLKIPNLIIEFHERFFSDGVKRMKQAFATLRKAGYVHVWTSKLGIEALFVHEDYIKAKARANGNEKNKKVIYTCISGEYDSLRDYLIVSDDWDYICFSRNCQAKCIQ
jgi:FkbM family methyltransferase